MAVRKPKKSTKGSKGRSKKGFKGTANIIAALEEKPSTRDAQALAAWIGRQNGKLPG